MSFAPETPPRTRSLAAAGVATAAAFLLARALPDVATRPVSGDEALAGLVAVQPLPEVVRTVLEERGGAPLHFVLAHVALTVDGSVEALRALSLVFAVATVPLCFDIGRRLAGTTAGVVAAVVAATSGTLLASSAFGRMYALFAFAAALAADLFVRALERRTAGAVWAAAGAAWLLLAIHPYGAAPAAAMVVAGLICWRGRPLRPALPVLAVGVAALPFAWADLRFMRRFEVGGTGGVVEPSQVGSFFRSSLESYAAPAWWIIAAMLALVGAVVLARRRPAFLLFAVLAVVLPPLLLLLVSADGHPSLSTRHMIYGLPLWASFVGAGAAAAAGRLRPRLRLAAVIALALAAALATLDEPAEPRDPSAAPSALEQPAAWLVANVRDEDVLFPYSPVYFAALPATRSATVLVSRGPGVPTREALTRVDFPVGHLFVAFVVRGSTVDVDRMDRLLKPSSEAYRAGDWLLLKLRGPFGDGTSLFTAALAAVSAVRQTVPLRSEPLRRDLSLSYATLCRAVRDLGQTCDLLESRGD